MIPALLLLACAHTPAVTPVAVDAEGPLMTVGSPTISRESDGTCVFDGGRHYVVSVHAALGETPFVEELGVWALQAGLAGEILLDTFGEAPPERLELVLGRDLPPPLAAELLRLAARHAPLPVVPSVAEEDAEACSRARAYVGSLLPTENPAWSAAELDQAAGRAEDAAGFWAHLPASGR